MHLSIQFDYREDSTFSLPELGIEEGVQDFSAELSCWNLAYGDFGGMSGHRAFSRLLGQRLIRPLSKEKSGFWGFSEEPKKKFVDFIISVDENGDEVFHTSDPDALANYFGANPHAPHYLTGVHFRKQVLDKYYQQPGKYSVEDAMLRCGSLWLLQFDNHHEDKVCAWLGDLGRDLPYEDQLHWRAYNIAPQGGVSETYFKRQILAIPTDSDRPEHEFMRRYHKLSESCQEYLGWQLLLPLDDKDAHHFKCIRIPATDEQRDFDELILALTKIMVDSINESRLKRILPENTRSSVSGSISRLNAVLDHVGLKDASDHIQFLRKLQLLRSASAAHRKGDNYRKIATEFGVDSQSLRSVFAGILRQSLLFLDYLNGIARSNLLRDNK